MGRSRARCAEDRELMYDSAIRSALGGGDDWKALKRAVDYLLSEAWKRRERHAADGALIASDVAGVIRCLASSLPEFCPARPPGCGRGAPRPVDLLAVYEDAVQRGAEVAP
jgi:hypothetical protein